MSASPLASSDLDDEIDLMALARLLSQGRWLILTCALIAALVGGCYALILATPHYPAQTTIALQEADQPIIGDIESLFAGGSLDTSSINTEFEIIRSRNLIGQLVDRLDLTADPEFNMHLRPPTVLSRVVDLLGGGSDDPVSEAVIRSHVIDAVIESVTVSNVRNSFAIIIGIETHDPEKSTLIVNTLATLYIEDQIREKLDGSAQAIEFLSLRTAELEQSVALLEQDLSRRREDTSAITPEVLQARNLQLGDLRDRIDDLRVRAASDAATVAALDADLPLDELVERIAATADPRLTSLLQRFEANRVSEAGLRATVAAIAAELQSAVTRSTQQLQALEASEVALAASLRGQAEDLIDLQQLEREAEAAQLLFETFFTRLQEASVQQGLETADARILSEAVPRDPSRPRAGLIVALAAVLGGFAGIGATIVRELRFAGFRTSDDVLRETGQKVYGQIPSLGNSTRQTALEHVKGNPTSIFAEAVRNLRTSILMSHLDRPPQVILMTSAIPGEGKTTLSIALTRYLASMEDKRALLLEADIRRNTLRAYVRRAPDVTLLDVLLGRVKVDEADLFNEDLGIELLAGSDSDSNAVDLFSSRRFGDLIARLRNDFDYIIIDSPPVLAVPDARVLATYSDVVLFAVKWSSTSKLQARQGFEMLSSIGKSPDGVVLTQIDQKRMKAYGYAGQYGYDNTSSGYYGSITAS